MTDKIEEQISALVDDEVHDSELKRVVAELTRNPSAAERWQRYHLISDALHNNLPDLVETDLSRRVREALEEEPTVLAPQRMRIPPRVRATLKQVGGMAIAASVAVVMVTVLQEPAGTEGGQQPLAKEGREGAPAAAPVTQVADVTPAEPVMRAASQPVATVPSVTPPHPTRVADVEPPRPVVVSPHAFDPRFESYLINHSEYAVTSGMLPYSRVMVGSTSAAVPQTANGE